MRPKSEIPPAPLEDPLRGPYWGWPGGGEREWLGFDSGEVPLTNLSPAAEGWVFETVKLPKSCEAVFTLGGLSKVEHGTVRISVNGRSLQSPGGWFLENDSYTFPFTLMFHQGINRVEIACYGWPANRGGIGYGAPPDLGTAWYRLSQAYHHPRSWTSPKIAMDTDSPQWHEANTALLSESVEEFRIDGVHVDSTVLWKWDERGFFPYLKRRLPAGTVFGAEVASAQGLGFFAFCQTRPKALPSLGGWQPRRSDLPWKISRRYQRYYLHLCAPGGFVPVGSACSVDPIPPSLTADEIRQTESLLALSRASNLLYTLRVNYRDYKLDEGTRRFLLEKVIKG